MEALALVQEWIQTIGRVAGLNEQNTSLNSGAIGAPESRLEVIRMSHTLIVFLFISCHRQTLSPNEEFQPHLPCKSFIFMLRIYDRII